MSDLLQFQRERKRVLATRVPRHPIVRQIVARCHVAESYLSVCRYFVSRMREGYATFRALPPVDRRALLLQCVAEHAANRDLYSQVMRGRPWRQR